MSHKKVIVSCSGKFHAFALVEQLQLHGSLSKFYTAYSSIKTPWLVRFAKRIDKETIEKANIKTNIFIAIGIKLFNNPHFWNSLFDRWVAFNLRFTKADVFIGWSGMSSRSIKVANAKGMLTIVERGSSHIEYQNEILHAEYKKFGIDFNIDKRVIKKELIEYQIADLISIPSIFVRNSFLEKKVSAQKLMLNNYGASNYFKPDNSLIGDKQKFRILYVGALSVQKGLIYLFEALAQLTEKGIEFEAWFIGAIDAEIQPLINKYKKDNWKIWGHLPHYDLPKYISACDVAVQSSLQEGLSMVIAQIIACKVPVIATTNTGGEDIIEEGKTGFIIPIRDAKAIAEKIELLYHNPEQLASMKQNNLQVPTWEAYGVRYVSNISNLKKQI